jgi:hypothetical protein
MERNLLVELHKLGGFQQSIQLTSIATYDDDDERASFVCALFFSEGSPQIP